MVTITTYNSLFRSSKDEQSSVRASRPGHAAPRVPLVQRCGNSSRATAATIVAHERGRLSAVSRSYSNYSNTETSPPSSEASKLDVGKPPAQLEQPEQQTTTIGIVGAGNVAVALASALIHQNICARIIVNDILPDKCLGEVLDLQDAAYHNGGSCCSVACAELEDLAACDVVVITAGAKSRPGESRLDLLSRNAETLTAVIDGLFPGRHSGAPPPNPRTVLLVVSNPVDVLTRIAQLLTDGILPRNQVIGSGTYLDSVRLRVHIGAALGICPSSVDAYVVGEHGDSQVALCSAVQVGGSRLMGVKDGSVAAAASETAGGFPSRLLQAPAVRAKFSSAVARRGPDIVALKGATSHGVGAAVAHMCDCILRDKQEVLPASVYVDQLRACVVWPAVLGRSGAGRLMDLELSPEEEEALRKSVSIVSAAVEPYTKPPFV